MRNSLGSLAYPLHAVWPLFSLLSLATSCTHWDTQVPLIVFVSICASSPNPCCSGASSWSHLLKHDICSPGHYLCFSCDPIWPGSPYCLRPRSHAYEQKKAVREETSKCNDIDIVSVAVCSACVSGPPSYSNTWLCWLSVGAAVRRVSLLFLDVSFWVRCR